MFVNIGEIDISQGRVPACHKLRPLARWAAVVTVHIANGERWLREQLAAGKEPDEGP